MFLFKVSSIQIDIRRTGKLTVLRRHRLITSDMRVTSLSSVIQELRAAHATLQEELAQVEKVRGEFSALLPRLEAALARAQV